MLRVEHGHRADVRKLVADYEPDPQVASSKFETRTLSTVGNITAIRSPLCEKGPKGNCQRRIFDRARLESLRIDIDV